MGSVNYQPLVFNLEIENEHVWEKFEVMCKI